jgi:signal transduction histidine kinase
LSSIFIDVLRDNLLVRLVKDNEKLQLDILNKDTYNASIIHELRNPLNAVLGSISLLKLSKSLTSPED